MVVFFTCMLQQLCAKLPAIQSDFNSFLDKMSSQHSTWKFRVGFVLHDFSAYLVLWLSIRGGNWKLRMGSFKQMALIFHALDRTN